MPGQSKPDSFRRTMHARCAGWRTPRTGRDVISGLMETPAIVEVREARKQFDPVPQENALYP